MNYLIDTNALISFITDRNPIQQEIIAPYFVQATEGKSEIILHFTVLTEFVYVMQKIYHIETEFLNSLLTQLISSKGIKTSNEVNEINILKIWPNITKDWGDAVLANYVLQNKDIHFLSFDVKLRNILKSQDIFVEEI